MNIRNRALKELKRTFEQKLRNIQETSKSILSRLDAHVKEPRRDLKSMAPIVIPAVIIRIYKKCQDFTPKEKNALDDEKPEEKADEKEFKETNEDEEEVQNKKNEPEPVNCS